MKRNLIILILLSWALFGFSQKKKDVRRLGIQSVTEVETKGSKTITDNKVTFDKDGEKAEEVNYDKEGQLKTILKSKHNKDGDVTEELEYDGKNNLVEKRAMKYNGLGEKVEELVTDKDGKVIRKIVYKYNSQGLKTEKITYDASNIILSQKKFIYSFGKPNPKLEKSEAIREED